jgi:uncharacterized damage-inducible protein DinB
VEPSATFATMAGSLMDDAFAHHVWATTRLIHACRPLAPDQLEVPVPGTYGPIIGTFRHLVGADSWYLFDITGDPARRVEAEQMDLGELRAVMGADGSAWAAYLDTTPDPNALLTEVDEDDGYERDAMVGVRLAQALHHGTDHRSQICTALTSLGMEPPSIDAWDYGVDTGRVIERLPPTT